MPDWNNEAISTFRAMARWDHEAAKQVYGDGYVAVLDVATTELRQKLVSEAGLDVTNADHLYAFIIGSHANWAHALGDTVETCDNPLTCLPGYVVHSANASMRWRVGLRSFINALPGMPAEPEPIQPPEYGIVPA